MNNRLFLGGLPVVALVLFALSSFIATPATHAVCYSPPEQCDQGCVQYKVNMEAYNLCVNDCNTTYTTQADWDAYNKCKQDESASTQQHNVNCEGALTPSQEDYCDAQKAQSEQPAPTPKPTLGKPTSKILYAGKDFKYGDTVTAGDNEVKTVVFEDGSKIMLNKGTSFTYINNNEVSAGLSGQFDFFIQKIKLRQFKLRTPTAVTSVRGTNFLADTDSDGATTIKMLDGTVDVSDPDGKKTVQVKTGYQLTVDKSGTIGTPKKLALTTGDKWYQSITPFSDVGIDNPFYLAIQYLKDNKIVQGYSDGTFKPSSTINRAEFTKIIITTLVPKPTGSKCFSDVKDEWYAPSVCTAKGKRFIGGFADGSFRPTQSVSLAEALKIIMLALKTNLSKNTGSNWYDVYLNTASELKILSNLSDAKPDHVLNRGEMAELIYRLKQ
jgi:hypothetical protein